jgi:16S rRNA (guanine(966)-N(2))-methyltransferase RsmD
LEYVLYRETETVRVIAGDRKGIALRSGRGPVHRPTTQLVRGSIFDTIGEEISGAVFLDLFAGSGGVGIEALSRGAGRVVFVEQDHRILKALRTNLQRCRYTHENAEVRVGDAVRYLRRLVAGEDTFDIVFADPPYAGNVAQNIVAMVEEAGRVVCSLLVIEHGVTISHNEGGILEKLRTRKFGQTYVSYFRVKESGV